jgi:hypothetical protein
MLRLTNTVGELYVYTPMYSHVICTRVASVINEHEKACEEHTDIVLSGNSRRYFITNVSRDVGSAATAAVYVYMYLNLLKPSGNFTYQQV